MWARPSVMSCTNRSDVSFRLNAHPPPPPLHVSDLYKLALPVCAKKLGAIKPQAFALSAGALIGSIKAQIDCTYQCSHCFTWCGSYALHVCLISRVLTGSNQSTSHVTPAWERFSVHHCSDFQFCCFLCFWLNFFPFFATKTQRFRENNCVRSLFSRIQNNQKRVIKSKPQADRRIIQSHFVLMSKHNTTHVNCCDPRNPPKRNIDILFVQRETLYNLHSLMTVHGNTGWRTTSVPHLALIQFSLGTRWTNGESVCTSANS